MTSFYNKEQAVFMPLEEKNAVPELLREWIVVVSGLPRSGTSMMMKMLEAGGLPILTDYQRTADADNPKGYYEFERVKKLRNGDTAWMAEAQGKAVKIISSLLMEISREFRYKVVFMERALPEVLASQRQMLIRRGEPVDSEDDARLSAAYEKHLAQVKNWLAAQPNIETLYVNHREAVTAPGPVTARINAFLGGGLNAAAMAAVAEPDLYRQRNSRKDRQ